MSKDGVDAHGGPCYSKYERVRVESTWRERLQKESNRRALSESCGSRPTFQMNLANQCGSGGLLALKHSHNRIELITEKEIKTTPAERESAGGMDPNSLEATAIRRFGKKPTEKFDMPMVSAHDIGWLLAKPMRPRSSSCHPSLSQDKDRQIGEHAGTSVVLPPISREEMPLAAVRKLNGTTWRRPKGLCDVTQYSETYMSLLHHNPFNQAAAGR
mmetsp:Transcript_48077/g.127292  ORF Transcript_48077/g.127292 Transcript_48077/m.127292 type:complete len:215 (-) Transcript_48077:168-812(-)|eukprot:CAMPEP_0194485518 /NCGR_PEP_ID=MMETSP0253-20130528/6511_1 /TAXON_ID=2966 /ORGANISM="Noctiluca scintillans" /LENGTH=214 /DNA_ID=CAMNT_0039325515 /DNA_START=53 /DNA_END=697 /DNA_ORIENTATION=-